VNPKTEVGHERTYKEHKARRPDSEGRKEAGNFPLKYPLRPFLCALCTTIQQSLCSLRKFFLLILILILILILALLFGCGASRAVFICGNSIWEFGSKIRSIAAARLM